jgi:hypothetical protein
VCNLAQYLVHRKHLIAVCRVTIYMKRHGKDREVTPCPQVIKGVSPFVLDPKLV